MASYRYIYYFVIVLLKVKLHVLFINKRPFSALKNYCLTSINNNKKIQLMNISNIKYSTRKMEIMIMK